MKRLLALLLTTASLLASAGFPGTFNSKAPESTGFLNIGAIQKQKTSATAGFPGAMNSKASESTGYRGIGAVQKDDQASASTNSSNRSLIIIIP